MICAARALAALAWHSSVRARATDTAESGQLPSTGDPSPEVTLPRDLPGALVVGDRVTGTSMPAARCARSRHGRPSLPTSA